MKRITPKCPECGKRYLPPATTALTGTTHGESFSIVSDALVCPNCGFKTIPAAKMGEFALRVADAYREKHGLLTSSHIKDRRRDLGMSQQQFAMYLGVGSSSVKRWELGWIQDKAMNDLILLKTDLRAAEANVAEVLARLGRPLGKSKIRPALSSRTLRSTSLN
jgi:putative zinc finger/helix-turn-helix YgiT family protein